MSESERPYILRSLAELPESLRLPVERCLPADEPAQIALMIPRHTQTLVSHQRYVPQQALLFTPLGVLQVQDSTLAGQPPTATYLRAADLLYAHHTLILLYGCLDLEGVVAGQVTRIFAEYNTVGLPHLQPSLQKFLRLAYGPPSSGVPGDDRTEALLQQLERQSLKFWNGLRLDALQRNEQLQGYVYQRRITRRLAYVFQYPIAPAALLALTDCAVVVVEEVLARGGAYGTHVTWCPRKYIEGMDTQPKKAWREVRVRLAKDMVRVERRVTLEQAAAQGWDTLWAHRRQ